MCVELIVSLDTDTLRLKQKKEKQAHTYVIEAVFIPFNGSKIDFSAVEGCKFLKHLPGSTRKSSRFWPAALFCTLQVVLLDVTYKLSFHQHSTILQRSASVSDFVVVVTVFAVL